MQVFMCVAFTVQGKNAFILTTLIWVSVHSSPQSIPSRKMSIIMSPVGVRRNLFILHELFHHMDREGNPAFLHDKGPVVLNDGEVHKEPKHLQNDGGRNL